jgi:hypothetical protein
VLTFAPFYRKNEDANRQLGENFGLCEWIASFTKSSLPKDVKTTTIAAWALDVSTGKALRLGGAVKLKLAPGDPATQ